MERSLSVAALFISLFALAFTGWQSWLTYQHNRVSLSPKLVGMTHLTDSSEGLFRVELVNVGLGPAVIHDASITFENEALGGLSETACVDLAGLLGVNPKDHEFMTCFSASKGEKLYLKSGEKFTLFRLGRRVDGKIVQFSAHPQKAVNVAAKYCSFYDKCESLN